MQLHSSAALTVPAGLVLRGVWLGRIRLGVHYGLIDRGDEGLCLVDTGYGPSVTDGDQRSALVRCHNAMLRPTLVPSGQPAAVLARLGKSVDDVKTVVLTHFHPDHVANLSRFPRARIIASGRAAQAIAGMGAIRANRHGVLKELLPADVFSRVTPLEDFALKPTWTRLNLGHDIFGDGSYLAIPLPGHAIGHFGLLWRDATGPVCYAADATWTLEALTQNRAAGFARWLVFADRKAGRESEALLRAFIAEGGRVRLAHEEITAPF